MRVGLFKDCESAVQVFSLDCGISYIGLFIVCSWHMDDHTLHSLHLNSGGSEGYAPHCQKNVEHVCDCNCNILAVVIGAYQFLD